jgi:malonate transporter and related proteins
VWAPAVGLVIVLLGIPVSSLIKSMLSLIGQASSGVALFVSGLMLAAHKVKLQRVVSINTVMKSLGQPLLMLAFVLMFGLTKPRFYSYIHLQFHLLSSRFTFLFY